MNARQQDDGAVLVEFSIVFVLFALLVSGLIQYGVIFAAQQSMAHAAGEAARSVVNIIDDEDPADGVADDAEEEIRTVLGDDLRWMDGTIVAGDGAGIDFVINCVGCTDGDVTPRGETVCASCIEVTVTYNWADDPLVPQIIPVGTPTVLTAAANVKYQ